MTDRKHALLTHEHALKWVNRWLDSYGCAAPEMAEARRREIADDFREHMRTARATAFTDAAHACVDEIVPAGQAGNAPEAETMRFAVEACLRTMSQKFWNLAHESVGHVPAPPPKPTLSVVKGGRTDV